MKRLLYLGLALTGILSLTAFLFSLYKSWQLNTFDPEPEAALVYHFSLYIPDNRTSFFEGIIRGAELAALELNSAVSIHSIDPSKNELENASFTGIDGVIVCPYLNDALARRQLEKIRTRQIPAVLINHNIPSDRPWTFIGINNFEMGRRIGNILSDSGEKLGLVVVYSDKAPGIYAERELVEMGISASLGDKLTDPILSFRTNLNPLDAEALLAIIFRSPPSRTGDSIDSIPERAFINTIIFTDPMDTTAAAQTLVDLNLVGQVNIIGFGDDPGVIENLRKGIISASVVINSERIGYEAVHSLAALRTTGYSSASIDIGVNIITSGDCN